VCVATPAHFRFRFRRAWRAADAPLPAHTERRVRPDGREHLLTAVGTPGRARRPGFRLGATTSTIDATAAMLDRFDGVGVR
jgi:hypothetical protein